ncbi:hypothetical protein AAHC03_05619 [Spirometra sp. Aus1]
MALAKTDKEGQLEMKDYYEKCGNIQDELASVRKMDNELKEELRKIVEAAPLLPPQPDTMQTYIQGRWIRTCAFRWSDRTSKAKILLKPEPFFWNSFTPEFDEEDCNCLDNSIRTSETEKEILGAFFDKVHFAMYDINKLPIARSCPMKVASSLESTLRLPFFENQMLTKNLSLYGEEPWSKDGYINWLTPEEMLPQMCYKDRRLFLEILKNTLGDLLASPQKTKPPEGIQHAAGYTKVVDEVCEEEEGEESSLDHPVSRVLSPSDWPSRTYELRKTENLAQAFHERISYLPWFIQSRMARSFRGMLTIQSSRVNPKDYLRFLVDRQTNYLVQVYHLYESREKRRRRKATQKLAELTTKFQRLCCQHKRDEKAAMRTLMKEKLSYYEGKWNTNCVKISGLSGTPDLPESMISQHEKEKEDLVTEITEVQSIIPDAEKLQIQQLDWPKLNYKSLQFRMERVWDRLLLSEAERTSQCIRYCLRADSSLVPLQTGVLTPHVVEVWEQASALVAQREKVMGKLAALEFAILHPHYVQLPRKFTVLVFSFLQSFFPVLALAFIPCLLNARSLLFLEPEFQPERDVSGSF